MLRPLRDLVLLTVLCAVVFFTGLTSHGLTNWQEAQRALAAREMQARGDWIVPTIDGAPYLAKPPLFYWLQLAIAEVRGARTGELELRLAAALCAWAGVVATYLVARRLFQPFPTESAPPTAQDDRPRRAALWAGLFLATGLLYVRSGRIGELDIALVPLVVGAIGAIHGAWRSHLERGRTHWGAVALATLASIGAVLAKGPPALLVVALGGYGGIATGLAFDALRPELAALRGAWTRGSVRAIPAAWRRAIIGACVASPLFVIAGIRSAWAESNGLDRVTGLIAFDLMGDVAGGLIGVMCSRRAMGALLRTLARTHPVLVLGAPALALWGWGKAVEARVGADAVRAAARAEAADNLRLFVLESPLNNLEAIGYGVGLGSFAAIAGCVALARRPPRWTPGLSILAAWVVLNLIAFSTLGKGVPRYLTPLWPAIAMVGGLWLTDALARSHRRRAWTAVFATLAVLLGAGQALWYGWARERWYSDRSPRALVRELIRSGALPPPATSTTSGAAPALAMFEFDTPAVDFYAERPVPSYLDTVPRPGVAGVGPETLAELRGALERGGATILLVRRAQPKGMDATPAVARLEGAGFAVEPVPASARFTIDNRRADVIAIRVRHLQGSDGPR